MKKAIYPGSFDPVTYGHLDIIKRAAKVSDKLIVAVLENDRKTPLFTVEERVSMLKRAVKNLKNVEVRSFSGLTVDFARQEKADYLIRGLRAVTDFEYELQLSQTNKKLAPEVETVFLTTDLQYAYLSSSIVKEAAFYGSDITEFVPAFVADKVHKKMKK